MTRDQQYARIVDADIHESAEIHDHVNLYGCTVGAETKIDAFVYIEEDVRIGRGCTIRPFVFIPTGVTIEDQVFIGPGVTFTNDRDPSTTGEWERERTLLEAGASVGAGVTVLPDVTIGAEATVGAGAVVTQDVPPDTTVVGNPATEV